MNDAVDSWLQDMDERLAIWGARREPVLAELEDGLRCAAEAYRQQGLAPGEAEAAAAAEFGEPAQIAQRLARELAAVLSRVIALRLLGSGPVLGAMWLLALVVSTPVLDDPAPLPARLATVVLAAVPLLPAAIIGTSAATGLAVLATGHGERVPLWLAPTATAAACGAVVLGDLMLLLALVARVARVPLPALLLLTLAGVASLTRIAIAMRCARRCLSARVHLT
jgi:hypothetical protein